MACEGRDERSTLATLPGPFGLVLVSGFMPFLSRPVPIGDSKNQACIPLAHRPGDRFPTGDLIAHCTVHFPGGRLVNEGARPRHGGSLFQNCKSTGPERSPGPVERLGFGDSYAFETASCSACASSK